MLSNLHHQLHANTFYTTGVANHRSIHKMSCIYLPYTRLFLVYHSVYFQFKVAFLKTSLIKILCTYFVISQIPYMQKVLLFNLILCWNINYHLLTLAHNSKCYVARSQCGPGGAPMAHPERCCVVCDHRLHVHSAARRQHGRFRWLGALRGGGTFVIICHNPLVIVLGAIA